VAKPTEEIIKKFVHHCVQEPKNPLDVDKVQKEWKYGYFKHTVSSGENLGSIARYYATGGKAPKGFDWKFLARFNWGVDKPAYINWCLIDAFGFDEKVNLSKNKRSYSLKGGEEILIPSSAHAAKPGAVAPLILNKIVKGKIRILTVQGPSLMTPDIESRFKVTGYSEPDSAVPDATKKSINWKIKKLKDGSESLHPTQGETVWLKYSEADVGNYYRAYPYIGDEKNINEYVYVEFQVLKLELDHEVSRSKLADKLVLATDSINKIYNPAAIVIGGNTDKTAAKFRITFVEPDPRAKKEDQKFPWPGLPANDEGLEWRIKTGGKNRTGQAKFVKTGIVEDKTGSECVVYGVKPGYITLEAWCRYAKKAFASLTLKVVNERTIRYRVNLLSSKPFGVKKTIRKTIFTADHVEEFMKIANVYLRQIGVKLVPDSDNTTYAKVGTTNVGTITPVVGKSGYFELRINCRPTVINYVFAYRDKSDFTSGGYTFGIGPTAGRNLHTKPKGHASATKPGKVPLTYKGVYELLDPSDETKFKKMRMFPTPDTYSGKFDKIGIVIYNPLKKDYPKGGKFTEKYDSEMGATLAHELGHCVSLRHRGGDPSSEGTKPDLRPSSRENCMYWTTAKAGPADLDVLQLDLFRATVMTMHNSNSGGLKIKAFLGPSKKVSGKKNSTKYVDIEVTRGTTRVAGAYMNFWIKGKNGIVKIEDVKYWDKNTRKMNTGLVKLTLKLGNKANRKANILVFTGENDDMVMTEFECAVTP
jgi:hypothetical protein